MLRDSPQTGNLVDVGDHECLRAGEVIDIPHLDDPFVIARDYAWIYVRAVHTHEWGFVALQLHRWLLPVRVPDDNLEVEPTAHQYLLLLCIGEVPHCFLMASEYLVWLFDIFLQYGGSHFVLFSFLLAGFSCFLSAASLELRLFVVLKLGLLSRLVLDIQ